MKDDYYNSPKSVEEYIKLAEGLNGAPIIEKLKQFVDTNSSILEIGSGPGTDWRILNVDFNVIGSDNSIEFLQRLIANNPKGDFLELDAITLKINKSFDGIYSNKVLHHLNDYELISSIRRQYDIMNADGIICHSFWYGEGTEIYNNLFVNYHSEATIKSIVDQYFEIKVLEQYKEFENNDSLLFIGKKRA